ncbi:hypothetical protein L345_18579, partial [Ophiophagus hannah]
MKSLIRKSSEILEEPCPKWKM